MPIKDIYQSTNVEKYHILPGQISIRHTIKLLVSFDIRAQ
jgi:hypothetical protein